MIYSQCVANIILKINIYVNKFYCFIQLININIL